MVDDPHLGEPPGLVDAQPVTVSGGDLTLQPGRRLLVTKRTREPRPRGLGLVILAIIVAMLCGYVAILLKRSYEGQRQREQLACQVQRLGGEPIGGVRCPPKLRPTLVPSPTPSPVASPAVPMVIVVLPDGRTVTSPAPARSPAVRPPAPTQARRTTGPTSSSSRSPSPRATPSPTPLARICLPRVPCFPRSVPRR